MTAASAYPQQSPEPADGRPSEPSMEDILASIRRIIADDQNQGGKSPYANGTRRAAAAPSGGDGDRGMARTRTPYDDVLDLARLVPSADRDTPRTTVEPLHTSMERAAEPQAHADDEHTYEARTQVEESEAPVSSLRARLEEAKAPADDQDEDHGGGDLSVVASSDDAEGDLLSAPLGASVMSAFETLAATVVLQNTPMLERVMRDLLRPMLKTWLDDNLPALVERLVRTEIERVARGRG